MARPRDRVEIEISLLLFVAFVANLAVIVFTR
jgi:hypothetical protein